MITTPHPLLTSATQKTLFVRWYFTGMAIVMLGVSVAGFMPAITHPATRREPLTLLAAAHGIVFFAWLLLFLTQSVLVATGRVAWHRTVGLTSVVFLALMLPLGYTTTTAMVRRGYDLSGDQHVDPHPVAGYTLDAPASAVFNFFALLTFGALAVAAICYRRRPEIHKRLILFANIALMGAPIAHLVGHIPHLKLTPAAVLVPSCMFLLAGVARDYLAARRIHLLTAIVATMMFLSLPLQGAVIGPSAWWHRFANWISQ